MRQKALKMKQKRRKAKWPARPSIGDVSSIDKGCLDGFLYEPPPAGSPRSGLQAVFSLLEPYLEAKMTILAAKYITARLQNPL